jgi:hypothetical protein
MTLKQDGDFMSEFGLTPGSDPDEITKRIVRGMEPEHPLTAGNVPQVMIYQKPGSFGRNHLVYEGKFSLDVYAKTAAQARQIAERVFKLFHDRYIVSAGFHSYRCTLAYESDFATGITGVKGYETMYDVDYLRVN